MKQKTRSAIDLLLVEFAKPQFMTTTNSPATSPSARRYTVEFTFVGEDGAEATAARTARDRLHDAFRQIAVSLQDEKAPMSETATGPAWRDPAAGVEWTDGGPIELDFAGKIVLADLTVTEFFTGQDEIPSPEVRDEAGRPVDFFGAARWRPVTERKAPHE